MDKQTMNNILFKLENRIKEILSYIFMQFFCVIMGIIIVFLPMITMILIANIIIN